MTPNAPASIRALQSRSQGYIRVIEAAYHEVNSYLNAADAGFLLREKNLLNEGASPTKFAEYCLTGLAVIMENTVKDAFDMARTLGNLIELTDLGVHLPIIGFDRSLSRKQSPHAYGASCVIKPLSDDLRQTSETESAKSLRRVI